MLIDYWYEKIPANKFWKSLYILINISVDYKIIVIYNKLLSNLIINYHVINHSTNHLTT